MLFNSFAFLVFFPLVTVGYFVLPHRYRWGWLLAASCYFYMYFIPAYILILAATIVVDYCAGIGIERSRGTVRRSILGASIVANVGALAFFKYFNFINDNLIAFANVIGWNYPVQSFAIILPVGLSFHTFQAMSYTIEVYRGNQKAERHFGIYALYVMFYPQLVAGPIERPQNLLHQFRDHHTFDYNRVVSGLKLIAWGLFKKVVVADRLSFVVKPVFDDPSRFEGPSLVLATVFFAFQIFYDFSGYSDIAVGTARVMGFTLMTNFDRPYRSRNIGEFWRRWHISLSTWFKDYVYIPLGGNRVPLLRRCGNLLIVFVVSGLWHGANWTYVVWGGLHGGFLAASVATASFRTQWSGACGLSRYPRLHDGLRLVLTFSLVSSAWIFFRAASIHDAWQIVTHLGSGWSHVLTTHPLRSAFGAIGIGKIELLLCVLGIVVVEAIPFLQLRFPCHLRVVGWPWYMRWWVYYSVTAALLFGYVRESDQFIYFQF